LLDTCFPYQKHWRWRKKISPKLRLRPTRLHCVTSLKTVFFIATTLRTSNFTNFPSIQRDFKPLVLKNKSRLMPTPTTYWMAEPIVMKLGM
jgi:hypothetical protein